MDAAVLDKVVRTVEFRFNDCRGIQWRHGHKACVTVIFHNWFIKSITSTKTIITECRLLLLRWIDGHFPLLKV